ncbi:EF-hand [Ascoidea rubescens DSM 1968]|uniref:EF-hand n=1 Tax=Ascoidea rubescens DSM 1968 TaxID=1344418 RepID=A0A1D2VG45_9ASCO|nr:EF-hand [Ascoidea rubescens DSM 1968]ODV60490.1 EF-hand [Ascoidea rubescens DSM 1968]
MNRRSTYNGVPPLHDISNSGYQPQYQYQSQQQPIYYQNQSKPHNQYFHSAPGTSAQTYQEQQAYQSHPNIYGFRSVSQRPYSQPAPSGSTFVPQLFENSRGFPLWTQDVVTEIPGLMNLPQQRTGEVEEIQYKCQELFRRIDTDNSGEISQRELSEAIKNPDGTKFDNSTIRLMVKLFDRNKNNTLDFREFFFLYRYFNFWVDSFKSMDTDKSLTIDYEEFLNTLQIFQYNLSPNLSKFIFNKFSRANIQENYGLDYMISSKTPNAMKLGNYIECLIWLTKFTAFFQKFDTNNSGVATVNFEDFIIEQINMLI